jgi:alkyldihydroxyacetonephosphate synthase
MDIVERLVAELGPEHVSVAPNRLDERRHDTWFQSQLDDRGEHPAPKPRCVVCPSSTEQVQAALLVCRELRVPIVPFGLGSGVCGGVLASADTVVFDMSAMSQVREVSVTDLTATFEAGVRGTDAEARLNASGLTLGHYPQSIDRSSVGGWIATRAAGQFSTAYGNIEDMVLDIEAVLATGDIVRTRRTPRASAGPDLRHLLLGSEGILGIVTAATLSVRRQAEARLGAAYHLSTLRAGIELQRKIVQGGFLPPVMRLYDSTEASRMFSEWAEDGHALLVLVHEGADALVQAEYAQVHRLVVEAGARLADPACVDHWLAERNHVPDFAPFIENGVVVDTIEVAATWSRIGPIYDAAIDALRAVPGILAASAHSSHAYRSGLNLYFTFVAQPPERDRMSETYRECWDRVLRATAEGGGGIAHHHGIGRVRRSWLSQEVGEGGLRVLRALKRALDPDGIMNPGALLPE